jgi:hypothetical protein
MTTLLDISVPAIGWIVIPIGIALVFFAPRLLYLAAIFAIPFSATTVVNFGGSAVPTSANAFGIQAAIYLGLLWMGRELVTGLLKRALSAPSTVRTGVLLLIVFLTAAVASLAYPAISGGHFLVRTVEVSHSFAPLKFTMHDVTQTAYLAYGVALAAAVALRTVDRSWRRSTVQALLAGGIALAVWGWVQLLIVEAGHAYPRGIFNTNIQPQTQGYQETLVFSFGTVHRLSSAAVEPSIFAQCLLAIIALTVVSVIRGHVLLSRRLDIAGLIGMTVIMLLSTSTSAYVGIVVLGLLLAALSRRRSRRTREAAGFFAAGLVLFLLCLALRPVRGVLRASTLDKLHSWSARDRWTTISDAWWHFVRDPIFGTGWGTAPTHDLIVFLLANTGLVGFLAFAAVVTYLFAQLRSATESRFHTDDALAALSLGAVLSLGTVLLLNVVTGFAFVFGHMWVIFGLAIGCAGALELEVGSLRPFQDRRVSGDISLIDPTEGASRNPSSVPNNLP